MEDLIMSLIDTIEPKYESEASFSSLPLPTEVNLYLESDLYYIDISYSNVVMLSVSIWYGEQEITLSDNALREIYEYCELLLAAETDLIKSGYENERYEQHSNNYYIT